MGSARNRTAGLVPGLTVLSFLLSLLLGYLGLQDYICAPGRQGCLETAFSSASTADLVYYTLQLFVMGSEPLDVPGEYPGMLQVARFLAPFTTVLAVVQAILLLFGDWFTAHYVRWRPGHTIVAGDGRAAALLTERLLAEDQAVAVLGDPQLLAGAGGNRMLILTGDPSAERTLRAAGIGRTSRVFAVSDSWLTNAAVALAVSKFSGTRPRVYAQVQDDVLIAALRARHPVGPQAERRAIDVVSLKSVAARVLLDTDGPGYADDGSAHPTVIVGTGPFARTLLLELARAQRQARIDRKVTVVTKQPEVLAALAGQLVGLDLNPVEPTGTLPDARRVYVCFTDPDQILRTGLVHQPNSTGHVVLCLERLAGLGEALNGQTVFNAAGISVFGILEAACDPQRLADDLHDRLGRAIHARYVQDQLAEGAAVTGSVVPWERLDPQLRGDNLLAAADIERKLDSIGALIMPIGPPLPPFTFSEDQVELLAQAEHDRWMAAKKRDGVVFGPVRSDTTHPDMKPWERLDADAQAKDIAMVRGLPEVLAEAGLRIALRSDL